MFGVGSYFYEFAAVQITFINISLQFSSHNFQDLHAEICVKMDQTNHLPILSKRSNQHEVQRHGEVKSSTPPFNIPFNLQKLIFRNSFIFFGLK